MVKSRESKFSGGAITEASPPDLKRDTVASLAGRWNSLNFVRKRYSERYICHCSFRYHSC
jgi:hypothetical protein